MALEGRMSHHVLRELEKFSDDGESTLLMENQLDHLQNLLQQADSEMFGQGDVRIDREICIHDMAELSEILDKPAIPKKTKAKTKFQVDQAPAPKNILHLSTAENILDVLGLSEKPKKQPKEEKDIVIPEPSVVSSENEKQVAEQSPESPSKIVKNTGVEAEDIVSAFPAHDIVTKEPTSDPASEFIESPPNDIIEVQDSPEEPKEEVVSEERERKDEVPQASSTESYLIEHSSVAAMAVDTKNLEEGQQTTQEGHHTECLVEEEAIEHVEDEKNVEDHMEMVVVSDSDSGKPGIQTTESVEVVLPALDFIERDITAVASDTFILHPRHMVTKLKQEVKKLRADYDDVEQKNKRLSQANSSAGMSFESLHQHAQQLQEKLEQVQDELKEANTALAGSKTLVDELRNELSSKEAAYEAEIQSRVRYQKAAREMTEIVQSSCKDAALVEKITSLADKAEEEALTVPKMQFTDESNSVCMAESGSGIEEDTPTAAKAKEQGSYMCYFKACVWTT